ncbi:MarR family winged helix-turn-helix transcriptional regulator [Actinokineospora bangkokensis]|uniref:HTH marR-type domain-containing protein n=1 Tax=Actinokineospora bangkokensis TaxID=1193682 RepID=A0A1Q9LGF8_9PSEU|nr:MarR family transcriptional regulator [Actinokineospora bangkokensis]OLR91094.1 hypothetical protein BJP25_31685 [Actinokineospora bangkokensis]
MLLRGLTVDLTRFAQLFGEANGLHPTDLNALAVILDGGPDMTPSRLADALHLSPSATTSVLDRLERSGHVRRDRSPDDRRKVQLHLEESARALGQAHFGMLQSALGEAWSAFSDEEREVVGRFLASTTQAVVRAREEHLR